MIKLWPHHREQPRPIIPKGGGGVAVSFDLTFPKKQEPRAKTDAHQITPRQRWVLEVNNFTLTHCPECGQWLALRRIWDESTFDGRNGKMIRRFRAHFACPKWKRYVPWCNHYSNPYCPAPYKYYDVHPMYVMPTNSTESDTWVLTP